MSEAMYRQETNTSPDPWELLYQTAVTIEKMQKVDTNTLLTLSTIITRLNEVIAFNKGLEWRIRELEQRVLGQSDALRTKPIGKGKAD